MRETQALLDVIPLSLGHSCLHSYPQLWAYRAVAALCWCWIVIFDRSSIHRDLTLFKKTQFWSSHVKLELVKSAKTVVNLLCKEGVGKATQQMSGSFHSKQVLLSISIGQIEILAILGQV